MDLERVRGRAGKLGWRWGRAGRGQTGWWFWAWVRKDYCRVKEGFQTERGKSHNQICILEGSLWLLRGEDACRVRRAPLYPPNLVEQPGS